MATALAGVATVTNKPKYGLYMAGMQKSHARSEQTNLIRISYIPAYGAESCP